MFAYGQLSDLVDGRLVTPIRKVGDEIECLIEDGVTLENFSFYEFDFDKKPEDREIKDSYEDSSYEDSSYEEEQIISIDECLFNINTKFKDFAFLIKENKGENTFEWIETTDKLIFSERIII